MRPFWLKLDGGPSPLGVGVTASSADDARRLAADAFPYAVVTELKPVNDVAVLDQKHVVPNMGNIFARGVWFPLGWQGGRRD